MKTRRHKAGFHYAEARLGWASSQLVVIQGKDGIRHETLIPIENPHMLDHLRSQLNKIEEYWRKALG
jgi:hypothetical protein